MPAESDITAGIFSFLIAETISFIGIVEKYASCPLVSIEISIGFLPSLSGILASLTFIATLSMVIPNRPPACPIDST